MRRADASAAVSHRAARVAVVRFDTIWAATHPTMAQSLLRYANHWDPLEE